MAIKVKNKLQIFLAIIKIVFTFAVPKIRVMIYRPAAIVPEQEQ